MAATMRKLLALVASAALLFTLVAAMPGDSSAANLTGGTYTYLVGGEEVTFTVDPINRKDGLLLPAEVFQKFGISLEGATTRTITMRRSGVTAMVTLGNPVYSQNGKAKTVPTVALRLNGRLFLPADLLKDFGVEYALDGNYVSLRDLAEFATPVKTVTAEELINLKAGRSFTASARADSGITLNAEFTLLGDAILSASALNLDYGTRLKLQQMQQTNTLMLVKVSNPAFKSGGLITSGLYLVDSQKKQYEVVSVFDTGDGLVSGKLAPGAERMGVLVFPKLAVGGGAVSVFYDTMGTVLYTVSNP